MGDGAGLWQGTSAGRQQEEALACWIAVSSAMSLQSCGPHCEQVKKAQPTAKHHDMLEPELITAVETVHDLYTSAEKWW
eukprot:COSAG02_NODE_4549_length_5227_cov_25.421412_4_plen_79_part_00